MAGLVTVLEYLNKLQCAPSKQSNHTLGSTIGAGLPQLKQTSRLLLHLQCSTHSAKPRPSRSGTQRCSDIPGFCWRLVRYNANFTDSRSEPCRAPRPHRFQVSATALLDRRSASVHPKSPCPTSSGLQHTPHCFLRDHILPQSISMLVRSLVHGRSKLSSKVRTAIGLLALRFF